MNRAYNTVCALIVAAACVGVAFHSVWRMLLMIVVSLIVTLVIDVLTADVKMPRTVSDNISLGIFTLSIVMLGAKELVLG